MIPHTLATRIRAQHAAIREAVMAAFACADDDERRLALQMAASMAVQELERLALDVEHERPRMRTGFARTERRRVSAVREFLVVCDECGRARPEQEMVMTATVWRQAPQEHIEHFWRCRDECLVAAEGY